MPEEKLHIKYRSWSCPRALRSATYICGQCQGSSVCSAASGKTWWCCNSEVKSCRTVEGNKKQELHFAQRFHQVVPYIIFDVVNLEKILLFISQCVSGKCFCKSGYKLKSICELQIVTSLWDFTQFHCLKDCIRWNFTVEDQINNFLQTDDVGSKRYQQQGNGRFIQ